MSKGNSRRKGLTQKQQKKKEPEKKVDLAELNQRKFDEIEAAKRISDLKYSLFQTRCFNFLKKLVLGIVLLFLLALTAGLVILLACYILHNNTITQNLFNAVQCLVGVVSLIIGFWGWVLALKSNGNINQTGLHIDALPATRNPDPLIHEDDVNSSTL